jgi:protein SCO1
MRKSNFLITFIYLLMALGSALFISPLHAGRADPMGGTTPEKVPDKIDEARWDQRQGEEVPRDLQFRDEEGGIVRSGDVLATGKPTVLALVYYGCPNLCTLVLNGLVKTIEEMKNDPEFELGKDFQILSVSIDPTERPRLALGKQRSYLARLSLDPTSHAGVWRFLTADPQYAQGPRALSTAVGYHYSYDQVSHQYNHPSGLVVLDGEGRVTQYLMGIQFSPADLSRALELAKNGRPGNPIKDFLLACAHYNPFNEKNSQRVMVAIQCFSLAFLGLVAWAALKLRKPT